MVGELIVYPFVLMARRPGMALVTVGFGALVFIALDLAFAQIGYDALYDEMDASNGRLYFAVTSLLSYLIIAPAMASALEQLGQRAKAPALMDAVALVAVSIWYSVAVILPFLLVGGVAVAVLWPCVPEAYRMTVGIGLVCLLAVPAIYVSVRLFFAGPQTLVAERVQLFSTWPLTRGAFWPIAGLAVLSFVISMLIVSAPSLILEFAPIDDTWGQTGSPSWIAEVVLIEIAFAIGTYYMAAAQAFMFDKLAVEP
jgi:hypothetical protein